MISRDHVCAMAQYNQWMNRKLYDASVQLTDEQRRADRGAFFKSVHATLSHLVWGDSLWMSRFAENALLAAKLEDIVALSFDEMRELRENLDNEILQWAQSVDTGWLAADKTWTSAMYQKTFIRPTWLLVTHMFNHQTHHRGQVTTLLSQHGIDVGVTDLPMMPLFENYGG